MTPEQLRMATGVIMGICPIGLMLGRLGDHLTWKLDRWAEFCHSLDHWGWAIYFVPIMSAVAVWYGVAFVLMGSTFWVGPGAVLLIMTLNWLTHR